MIAIDTNILVHCHRRDTAFHAVAARQVRGLVSDRTAWAIPWPCIHEFFSAVTRSGVFSPPSSTTAAFDQVSAWLEGHAILLAEAPDHFGRITDLAINGRITGPRIHDARIAAICLSHGVSELWTADRDFSRFPALRTRNPLVENGASA